MNKSDIIQGAEEAAERLEAGSSWDYDHIYNATTAFQAAYQLQQKRIDELEIDIRSAIDHISVSQRDVLFILQAALTKDKP